MRPNALMALWSLLLCIGTVQADTLISPQQPIVVYDGRNTLSAQPYYRRLRQPDTTPSTAPSAALTAPHGAGVLALADRLPLSPTSLEVGPPQMKAVPGLITPLFVLGMDEVSLTWFAQAAQGLADIGARGLVVQASDLVAWRALKRRAHATGIDLMLLEGDALAQGYGISTYPTVLLASALAGEGVHE